MIQPPPKVAVVHLVWQGSGLPAFRRFIDSYIRFDAGAPHELILGVKGFDAGLPAEYSALLADIAHRIIPVPNRDKDIAAYRFLLDVLGPSHEDVLLLNSSSELLAADWLRLFMVARGASHEAVVGATGSFEAIPTAPVFPNPHLRTNAIFASIAFLRRLDWGDLSDGAQFEAGPRSLTRQVMALGGGARVVDRHGQAHGPAHWRDSATFRSGGQSGLLVADNRTREYAAGDAALRLWLHMHSWDGARPGPHPARPGLRRLMHDLVKGRGHRKRLRDRL